MLQQSHVFHGIRLEGQHTTPIDKLGKSQDVVDVRPAPHRLSDCILCPIVHRSARQPSRDNAGGTIPYIDTLAMNAATTTSPAILTARGMSCVSVMTAAPALVRPKMRNPA